ncbi:DapH/DapD/GlmU-related protein [Rhizobium sp.]|jgi:serine O-acetyltransferase|uniref:DapH/DapD/GlmU-related protein n=1 Tax=Rhizobium sp. TaxID=391 RepID=UPI000E9CBA70|nr:serine acetyltransferase [Rhizobium sp.]
MNGQASDTETFAQRLVAEVQDLYRRQPEIPALLGLSPEAANNPAHLLADILASTTGGQSASSHVRCLAADAFSSDTDGFRAAIADIETTARKNFEPGGLSATLLYSRGVHALLGHRVAHYYWMIAKTDLALALKTLFGRAFSTDIHPAAEFGKGIWLDHGLGFVVGETAIIGDNVSIWHGVTLGSTLKDNGTRRHPRLGPNVTIGADAILLGGIDIGTGSVIAAGSIVLRDVEPETTVAGVPARSKPRTGASFTGI